MTTTTRRGWALSSSLGNFWTLRNWAVRGIMSYLLVCALAALLSAGAHAKMTAGDHWRAMTLLDLQAAVRILLEDHPGTAPEIGDDRFRAALERATRLAEERAQQVTSHDGYRATLAGFAVALGDKHIAFRSLYPPSTVNWPGFLIVRRGNDWVVGSKHDLRGARLKECDGKAVDRLAEERLGGFALFWPIEAQRIQRAPLILIDAGNPFLRRPEKCTFVAPDTTEISQPLDWQPIAQSSIGEKIRELNLAGAAGFGVREAAGGYWIAIQSFSADASKVVEQVRAQSSTIRKAPVIVLDLRGNSGGNSVYGRMVAEHLLGREFVQARASAADQGALSEGLAYLGPQHAAA